MNEQKEAERRINNRYQWTECMDVISQNDNLRTCLKEEGIKVNIEYKEVYGLSLPSQGEEYDI